MIITKTERYEFYKNQLKKYKTKEQKIEYLEQLKFLIEMIDRWTDFDAESFNAVCELIKEVKNNE